MKPAKISGRTPKSILKSRPTFIDELTSKYPELKQYLERQETKIKQLKNRKKYGLVWEEEKTSEDIAKDGRLPVLKKITDKHIPLKTKNDQYNILIEGDNLHAISVLNYTHKEKIDIIYIDPPYNNGKKSWKYNNRFVDKNDSYQHSKWLSFMKKRLIVAKKLLKADGKLICAIDHNEQERLGLLLEEIFPNKEKICITIINNPSGQQGQNFSYIHEYAYFIIPKNKSINKVEREDDPDIRGLRDVTGDESLRSAAKNCFYPIYIKDGIIIGFGDVCKNSFHPKSPNIQKGNKIEIYPIDQNGVERKWRFARHTVEQIRNELRPHYIKNRKIWDIQRVKKYFPQKTVWVNKKYNSNNYGTQILNSIIETSFPYPKSKYTVYDCIKSCIHPKNAIILDFFAGSGTTGQAVLELNKHDNGSRKFILCTNNENNICTNDCYPRLKKVIKGYTDGKTHKKIEALGGGLMYYKIGRIEKEPHSSKEDPPVITDANKSRIIKEITDMLCVKEWCFDCIYQNKSIMYDFEIYKNNDGDYMGIIYDPSSIIQFVKKIDSIKKIKKIHTYVFSNIISSSIRNNKKIKFESIPTEILSIWNRIFESNIQRRSMR